MLGLDLPKQKRAGRSQSAQAWMEPITFSAGSKGDGPGESSKNIQPSVKAAMRTIRAANQWLFDRELALPASPDNGFRRGLFGAAARRILNFEQNEDTHRACLQAEEIAFRRWKEGQRRDDMGDGEELSSRFGWRRTVLTRAWASDQAEQREAELAEIASLSWANFDSARAEFADEERRRSERWVIEHSMRFADASPERIGAAMTRGWRDIYERLLPPGASQPPDPGTAERIIKAYQNDEPRRMGDINLFLWLATRPHLWRFVETMRRFNDFQRRLEQYRRPIQFRYPRHGLRPEWFTFSERSPGHMYTIVSMQPMVIDLCVFVPNEDVALVTKIAKGQELTKEEASRVKQPIQWSDYILSPSRLQDRRDQHRARLTDQCPEHSSACVLDEVQNWTNDVWQHLIQGFFRHDPPLDLSRFQRLMVRYTMSADARLGPVVDQPSTPRDLAGRLTVKTNERQKARWQGRYGFWFGPLAPHGAILSERRRSMRELPLNVGGIRLEYRGALRAHSDPLFTLSCDLDERIEDAEGKLVLPAPRHRIPKRERDEDDALTPAPDGTKRRRTGKRRTLPVGLRILSLDLGLRHIATGVVVEFVDDGKGTGTLPVPFKPKAVEFMDVRGVTLTHIQRHLDERRRKQRKACPKGTRRRFQIRGTHLPRGQEFARRLLVHADNLKDDRCKKAAHAIVRAAVQHQVDYIVFENLTGYRPDHEFGRRVNATLMTWNRRELVEAVEMEAVPLGVHVYQWVPPHHTSRFCHRCGGVGHRFTHVTRSIQAKDRLGPADPAVGKDGTPILDAKGKQVYRRRWTPDARRVRGVPLGLSAGMRQAMDGGKQFCCAECGLIINADYNAAMNLARKLADEFPAYARYQYDSVAKTWTINEIKMSPKAFWARAIALAQIRLNKVFRQDPGTPPAGGWPGGNGPEIADDPF